MKEELRLDKKKRIFTNKVMFLIVFSLIFVLFSNIVVAQEYCCLSSDTGCIPGDQVGYDDCINSDGYTDNISSSCSVIPECDNYGCCCGDSDTSYELAMECTSGSFIQGVDDALSCNALCSGNLVTVTGNVVYSDDYAADNAIVTFYNTETDDHHSSTTNADGNYTISIKKGTYDVIATMNGRTSCEFTKGDEVINNDATVDLKLSCNKDTSCDPEWQTGPWSNPDEKCGNRTVTKGNTLCTNPDLTEFPKPPEEAPCIPGGTQCNHDGDLKPWEECDRQLDDPFSGKTCDYFIPGSEGNLTCTDACTISTSGCTDCPTDADDCSIKQSYCSFCTICKGNPACTGTCKADTDISLSTSVVRDEDLGVKLDWALTPDDNSCAPERYDISRCVGKLDADGKNYVCATDVGLDRLLPIHDSPITHGDVTSLTDSDNLQFDKVYCYNITAEVLYDTTEVFYVSDFACAQMPSSKCEGMGKTEFCEVEPSGNHKVSYCDENGVYNPEGAESQGHIETCTSGQQCVGPFDDGDAWCANVTICELCNGPFGVFGYMNMNLASYYAYETADGDSISQCSDPRLDKICYKDSASKTNSAIGQNKECSDIYNCYDYNAEESCMNNLCKTDSAENCTWVSFTDSNELGLGVCMPKQEDLRECNECENNPLGCTEEICGFYGDCYYNAETGGKYIINQNRCVNIDEVGCETYDTKEECTTWYGTDVERDFDADIHYDDNEEDKPYGTNEINTESNSKYAHTKTCYWYEDEINPSSSRCLKDADMTRALSGSLESDCFDKSKDMRCLLDFEPPETDLALEGASFSKSQIRTMNPKKTDNMYSATDLITLYDISVPSAINTQIVNHSKKYSDQIMQYPMLSRAKFNTEISKLSPGQYVISFFSEDPAKNKEEIKQKTISIVEELASSIDLSWDVKSEYIRGSDKWVSNLTVTVSNSNEMNCKITLGNGLKNALAGSDRIKGKTMSVKFEDLSDGPYTLTTKCRDIYDQNYENVSTIAIDADRTISEPTPRNLKFTPQTINVSIKTNGTGTCYYTKQDIFNPRFTPSDHIDETPKEVFDKYFDVYEQGNNAYEFQHTGGTTHWSEIDFDGNTHEFQLYYTACKFDTGITFIGNDGDSIFFAVDSRAPTFEMIDADTSKKYDDRYAKEDLTIKFVCDDSKDDSLTIGDNPWDFGCKEVRVTRCYKKDDKELCDERPTVLNGDESWEMTFNKADLPKEGGYKYYINVEVEDAGRYPGTNKGNIDSKENIFLNVRDTTFDVPEVEIIET